MSRTGRRSRYHAAEPSIPYLDQLRALFTLAAEVRRGMWRNE
jgi:hypothetical protein